MKSVSINLTVKGADIDNLMHLDDNNVHRGRFFASAIRAFKDGLVDSGFNIIGQKGAAILPDDDKRVQWLVRNGIDPADFLGQALVAYTTGGFEYKRPEERAAKEESTAPTTAPTKEE